MTDSLTAPCSRIDSWQSHSSRRGVGSDSSEVCTTALASWSTAGSIARRGVGFCAGPRSPTRPEVGWCAAPRSPAQPGVGLRAAPSSQARRARTSETAPFTLPTVGPQANWVIWYAVRVTTVRMKGNWMRWVRGGDEFRRQQNPCNLRRHRPRQDRAATPVRDSLLRASANRKNAQLANFGRQVSPGKSRQTLRRRIHATGACAARYHGMEHPTRNGSAGLSNSMGSFTRSSSKLRIFARSWKRTACWTSRTGAAMCTSSSYAPVQRRRNR